MLENFKKHHKESFKNCLVVCNPNRKPKEVEKLHKILNYVDLEANEIIKENPIITKSASHLEDIVYEFYKSHYNSLIVFGGDGTVHITVNSSLTSIEELRKKGYNNLEDKSIGFFRGGSGNGIQDSYEVPFNLHNQVKAFGESLHNNYTVDVDLINVSYLKNNKMQNVYSQLVGFGLDCAVLKNREKNIYKRGPRQGFPKSGLLNYISAGLKTTLFDYKNSLVDLDIILHQGKYAPRGTRSNFQIPFGPDLPLKKLEKHVNSIMLELGSRPYYGKMLKICPEVVCNDENMDMYIFNFKNQFQIAYNFADLYLGNHAKINHRHTIKSNKPPIERYEIKQASIISKDPLDFHIDGDLYSCSEKFNKNYEIDFEVVPKALKFLVPPSFYQLTQPF